MNSKYWYYLFFADLLTELIAIAWGWNAVQIIAKPLLIAFLFAWFIISSSKFLPLRHYIAAALVFSWTGDVFLMLEQKGAIWFIAGLGSFLLAHVLYILFFLKSRSRQQPKKQWNLYIISIVALYAASLFVFLYPHIGNLKIPVGVYAFTIALMVITAVHAFNKRKDKAAVYCITGAVLFIVSDSLLALNKFYQPFSIAGVCIMLTYGLAQFAIVKGSLLYLVDEKPVNKNFLTEFV